MRSKGSGAVIGSGGVRGSGAVCENARAGVLKTSTKTSTQLNKTFLNFLINFIRLVFRIKYFVLCIFYEQTFEPLSLFLNPSSLLIPLILGGLPSEFLF